MATFTVEEQSQIIEENGGYITQVAKKYSERGKQLGHDISDLIQCGRIGFMKGMNKYDPNHESGANLLTYCKWYVSREIQRCLKSNRKGHIVPVSLDTKIEVKDGTVSVMDILANDEPSRHSHDRDVMYGKIREILAKDSKILSDTERTAIYMKYFEKTTDKEITEKIGKSGWYVVKSARKKIANAMKEFQTV